MVNFKVDRDMNGLSAEITRGEQRALYRTGAYGLAVMRNSMRRGAKTSAGRRRQQKKRAKRGSEHPPLVWEGGLKRSISYSVDMKNHSVVIGPASGLKRNNVPGLLERGGVALRETYSKGKGLQRKRVKYRPHPFAAPALRRTATEMARILQT